MRAGSRGGFRRFRAFLMFEQRKLRRKPSHNFYVNAAGGGVQGEWPQQQSLLYEWIKCEWMMLQEPYSADWVSGWSVTHACAEKNTLDPYEMRIHGKLLNSQIMLHNFNESSRWCGSFTSFQDDTFPVKILAIKDQHTWKRKPGAPLIRMTSSTPPGTNVYQFESTWPSLPTDFIQDTFYSTSLQTHSLPKLNLHELSNPQ